MPSPAEILRHLSDAANAWIGLAIAWHVVLAAVIVALLLGWRPSARLALLLLATSALSVSIASAAFGNPFNAISFAALVLVLVAIVRRVPPTRIVAHGPAWAFLAGAALIAYGAVYPHFLDDGGARYVIAAPLGLAPCPTLAVIAGLALLAGGFRSRSLVGVLGVWTSFYALFGIARLGVMLDVGLAAAPLALAALLVESRSVRSTQPRRAAGDTRA